MVFGNHEWDFHIAFQKQYICRNDNNFCIYFISDYFTLLFMPFLVDFFECSM